MGFRCLVFLLLNSSAEICAGSLAPGWCILGICANISQIFWYQNVSFGMLGAFTLASWGTLGRSWDDPVTLKSTRKDTVGSRLGFYH